MWSTVNDKRLKKEMKSKQNMWDFLVCHFISICASNINYQRERTIEHKVNRNAMRVKIYLHIYIQFAHESKINKNIPFENENGYIRINVSINSFNLELIVMPFSIQNFFVMLFDCLQCHSCFNSKKCISLSAFVLLTRLYGI